MYTVFYLPFTLARTVDIVTTVYGMLVKRLERQNYKSQEKHIEMFHASLDKKSHERITSAFKTSNSKIRILISTVAFGMGVQINDIRTVVHWGPPSSTLAYWHEVDRCARDGCSGCAKMLLPTRSVDQWHTDEALISLIRDESQCLRY